MFRPFEPDGSATQNSAMDGNAKTITLTVTAGRDTSVYIAVSGTQNVFMRLDGTAPTTSNALCLLPGTAQTFSMPSGKNTVKLIGAAGSTVYVTSGSYL